MRWELQFLPMREEPTLQWRGTMVRTPEYPGVLEQPFSARAGLGLNSLQAKLLCEALLAGLYTRPTLDCTYISFVIKHHQSP